MADLTNPNSTSKPQSSAGDATSASSEPPTILRCAIGSLIAGGFAAALYALTLSIVQTFANKPIHSDNITAGAVRTLVMGIVALGAGVFAFASLGLMLLALQLLIQKFVKKPTG
jgi:hypothetical protein